MYWPEVNNIFGYSENWSSKYGNEFYWCILTAENDVYLNELDDKFSR